jgi:hypothetical protein
MNNRTLTSGLMVAGVLVASGLAVAQEPFPDLKGTWIGHTYSLTQGNTEHYAQSGEAKPIFQDASWTLTVDRQEGSRFTGARGLTEGTRRDPILGVIRADRTTIHMVDDDGTFLATLTAPDAMEVCRTEVTTASHVVSCAEFNRQQ